jgi:hypothetical protein
MRGEKLTVSRRTIAFFLIAPFTWMALRCSLAGMMTRPQDVLREERLLAPFLTRRAAHRCRMPRQLKTFSRIGNFCALYF